MVGAVTNFRSFVLPIILVHLPLCDTIDSQKLYIKSVDTIDLMHVFIFDKSIVFRLSNYILYVHVPMLST